MTTPVKEKKYKWRRKDYQEQTKGLLMVHTGNGKGKTTCALGLMMRAAGRGLKYTQGAMALPGTRRIRTRTSIRPEKPGHCVSRSSGPATTICWSLMNWF